MRVTRGETEIIALIEAGYTDKDIAKKLALSLPAVGNRLGRICENPGGRQPPGTRALFHRTSPD
jgi:FixJ family two-component response regulator